MQRITMSTVLVLSGALLLSGCASGGATSAAPADDTCTTTASEVRDISNGVQNNLAAASDLDELDTYLDDASARVQALIDDLGDDEKLQSAVEGFQESVATATDYAGTLPQPDADGAIPQDPEALAEQQTSLQQASAKVSEVCAD